MIQHETYIKRCLQIAKSGLGNTHPNPMVGAIIVYNNKIIGEGFTSPYGGPHAEVNAINAVKQTPLLSKSTLYVTLEPCSHHGKTPPCSNFIIESKIPKVVIGCVDDNPEVAGKGIVRLKASGCNVIIGILEDECRKHHKRFFTFHNKKRPYIILKWAQTIDRFIAPKLKEIQKPIWITNNYSRQLVHKWRTEEQAILVGTNTVIEDNPSLTARDWKGNNPLRVILDKGYKLNKSYAVLDHKAKTIMIRSKLSDKVTKIENRNEEIEVRKKESITFEIIDWSKTNCIAKQICDVLYSKHINSLIIEGGTKTLQTFIDENLWDEARVFTSKIRFREGINAPKLNGKLINKTDILDDTLRTYLS